MMKVSLFKGYTDSRPQAEVELAKWLLSLAYREQVEQIRRISDKKIRRELKASLPCITPSGIFTKRTISGLVRHSGMICIDIDGEDNPSVSDWEQVKQTLNNFPGLYYAGLSTSGNGIFLIIRISDPARHREHFESLHRELSNRGLKVDVQCKDVSRLRGASYDPTPYFNSEAKCYTGQIEIMNLATTSASFPKKDRSNPACTRYRVRQLIALIRQQGVNIAESYADWYRLGCSLSAEFGEGGREYFHIVSSYSTKYRTEECDRQYDHCIAHCSRFTISTFFYLCKQNGLMIFNK